VLAENEALEDDKRRLDYLTELVQWEPHLSGKPGPDGSVFVSVDAAGKGSGEGATLREAIDVARKQQAA
jgi:hypothetical protein